MSTISYEILMQKRITVPHNGTTSHKSV